MGKYRSKSGCLTCRQRRVKCDEVKPKCGQCGKKNRGCQWDTQQMEFRVYRPESDSTHMLSDSQTQQMDINDKEDDDEDVVLAPSRRANNQKTSVQAARNIHIINNTAGRATVGLQQPSTSPFPSHLKSPVGTSASGRVTIPPTFSSALPTKNSVPVSRTDAMLVHHYAEHLGRWLDGTDAARQFTLSVPEQVKRCSILLHAVVCFAARHLRDDAKAEEAYQACLLLVIERLDMNTAMHDVDLLCAIVILRFFEQLNVPSESGNDQEQHLAAGTSAILRSSHTATVDPSAPTLREAAFWVYVRQCLYNATINQQPPNIDFSLQLYPEPASIQDHHPLAKLRLETAWSNQMTWHCARVANFCFERNLTTDMSSRMKIWSTLWEDIHQWKKNRPESFNPIWTGESGSSVFPEMLFIADWHTVAHGFYHYCCILLLNYKPGPKFALRIVGSRLSDNDLQVLEHARAICGSCKSSPEAVTSLITFCHTIFVWGPLLTDGRERQEVLWILANLERTQRWPTEWIVNALKKEWRFE